MIEKDTLRTRSAFSGFNGAPLISMISTLLSLSLFFLITRIAPFGPKSILISDLAAQYAPFLIGYKEHLLTTDMLSYSFLFGMGKNTMGLFAYYLASPFNFLTFLFPKTMISEAIVFLIMLKLSVSAAFATLFFQKRSGLKDRMSAVFGLMYALSSYAIVYMVNIMWLDGFLILPLLLLFLEQYLENERKWARLVILLFLLFVSGFYIAYMVGIFSFIYLVIRKIEEGSSGDQKKAVRQVLRYIGFAILAAGMSAIVLLPAGIDTLGNPDYRRAELAMSGRFVLTDILNQLFSGTFDTLHSNKPFLYSGLVTTLLIILYFINPGVRRRSKIILASILTGFLLSFNLSILDYVWHLFDLPNWFQYRNAFILVLILLLYAYLSFVHRNTLTPRHCIKAGAILLAAMIFVQTLGDMRIESERFYVNLVFGLLYFLILLGLTVPKWPDTIVRLQRIALPALIILIVVDVGIANPRIVRARALGSQSEPVSQLSADITDADLLVREAKGDQKSDGTVFGRIEIDGDVNGIEAISGGPTLGIHSISNFQSGSNKQLHRFLKQLGYATNYNYFTSSHSYTSVIPDSIFGITHILSEQEVLPGYVRIAEAGDKAVKESANGPEDTATVEDPYKSSVIGLFKNDSALPLLFAIRPDAYTFDFYAPEKDIETKDYFNFQNRWLASMFEKFPGEEGRGIYYPADHSEMMIFNAIRTDEERFALEVAKPLDWDTLGVEPISDDGSKLMYYMQINPETAISVDYEIIAQSEDPLFLCLPFMRCGFDGQVKVNGETVSYSNVSHYTMITYLGSFTPGEKIDVRLLFDKKQSAVAFMDPVINYCDTEKFAALLDAQAPASGISGLEVEDGRISARVSFDEERILLTTIPYERGWTLWVDDRETKIVPYQDALISVPLSAGTHSVRLEFRAPGLSLGVVISLISSCVFIAFAVIPRVSKRKSND